MLGWAYVLSQRWSELIPGAQAIEYTNSSAALSEGGGGFEKTDGRVIDLGVITDEALRWWAAVLAPGEGWTARINHNGVYLRSPWSVSLRSSKNLILTFRTKWSRDGRTTPPSYSTAAQIAIHRRLRKVPRNRRSKPSGFCSGITSASQTHCVEGVLLVLSSLAQ
ncbi:hypothetical protein E4U30_006722 [Claviceps sp. LM220 group G6]|nr:hypothetical protein E4U30_006722 [Claviceps sp. LM220 group G6]